jgi:stage II sporulation protein D
MKNKILGLIIITLILIYFIMPVKKEPVIIESKPDIEVHLKLNNQDLVLSLNDYLIGVVGAEMPASFFIDALKAQAIASRTYALYSVSNNIIETTTSDQAYFTDEELRNKWQDNYETYINKIKTSVNETNNQVMTYQDNLIKSYYYAMSNGYSDTALNVFKEDLPYLGVVDSTFDENNKNYEVTINMSKDEFCQKLNITCSNIVISNIQKDESKRVISLDINNQTISGVTLRKALNLRSTDFIIEVNDNIKITTKGYGHGCGMSQYGANYLAKEGYSYEDILKYYYQNIEIKNY